MVSQLLLPSVYSAFFNRIIERPLEGDIPKRNTAPSSGPLDNVSAISLQQVKFVKYLSVFIRGFDGEGIDRIVVHLFIEYCSEREEIFRARGVIDDIRTSR